MTTNLVDKLGRGGAFPTPRQLAASNEAFLREEVKTGYRSPYLLEFALRIGNGEIDLRAFAEWNGETSGLYK